MEIWIDGYEANVLQRLGSGQVAFELLRNLETLDHDNSYKILLPDEPLADLPKPRKNWQYKVLKPKFLWTKIALPLCLYTANPRPQVIFSPTHYIPQFSPVKRVGTIFDLSFLHFPETFTAKDLLQLKTGTKFSAKNSSHIITISNSSKDDIVQNYNVLPGKITVAYPGYNAKVFKPINNNRKLKEVKDKYGVSADYVIFIGTLQPRKNISLLIEAVAEIPSLKLLVVGKTTGQGRQGWKFQEILDKPKSLSVEGRVIFTGFLADEELVYLLSGALCFVLPSFWEGFGIPVVEAMACGVPVIVSSNSSLPEVAGDAGIYIDPRSKSDLIQAINNLRWDKKLRAEKSRLGIKQAEKFSWQKMTSQMLQTLEKVANE